MWHTQRYPSIPWKEMVGMCDALMPSYFGVDMETVWLVFTESVPTPRPLIAQVLAELEEQR